MDCEDSLSAERIWKYDVFLSFRAEDTSNKATDNDFTGDLFAALKREGIKTFIGDQKGKAISQKVLEAIEESRISIIVFSRNYAASTSCLEELAKIAECIDSVEQTVWPVYFDVDPFVVRKQRGVYQQAFAEHEERFRKNIKKVERWRKSMTKVANVSGWNVQNEIQTQVIYTIVKRVIGEWSHKCFSVADELVGIESRVKELEKLLDIGSDDVVRFVGICGMGGIGKTTLASIVYHGISHLFEACCFLDNVSEFSSNCDLIRLQKQLLRATLELKDFRIGTVIQGTRLINTNLRHLKTLLVLDDVDHYEKVEILAGNSDWFGAGSRIIITTRDEYVLKWHGVERIYNVQLLNEDEAFQLFCRNAFKCDYPVVGHKELTYSVLEEYAKGLPLAIKSLGLFLLHRNVLEWKSALANPQKNYRISVVKVLQKSVNGLGYLEREIFLDIACFFVGKQINYVRKILSYCRNYVDIGIASLIEKSLITLLDQRIQVHELLQETGQDIVRKRYPEEPGKRNRLWLHSDFRRVAETYACIYSQGINMKAVVLNQEDPEETPLMADVLSKWVCLRLLIIQNVNFSGKLEYLSNELRYLSWHKYPFTCLPSNFEPRWLVELIMSDSNVTELWKGMKIIPNLRSVDLRGSKNLMKIPDLKRLKNLERLDFEGCIGLSRIHPSIEGLPKLIFLNLKNCTNLVSVPNNLFSLSSLEILNLAGCSKLAECLNFDSLLSLTEGKLLCNEHLPIFRKLYYILWFLVEKFSNEDNVIIVISFVLLVYLLKFGSSNRQANVSNG